MRAAMDSVDVVKVSAEALLEQALDALREYDLRAVVIDHRQGKLRLHMNIELLWAIADGLERCGQVRGGRPVVLLDAISEKSLDAAVASYALSRSEAARLGAGQKESAASAPPLKINITTRHERFAAQIRNAAKACRCSYDRTHVVDCPPDWQNKPCPGDDGGKMDCY
jgi:hypothetical protein